MVRMLHIAEKHGIRIVLLLEIDVSGVEAKSSVMDMP